MASAVRFNKRERDVIRAAMDELLLARAGDAFDRIKRFGAVVQDIKAKLDKSEEPAQKRTGISVADALAAFREALGPRLVPPPSNAAGMYAQMAKRLAALGLSKLDCISVAKAAGAQWRGSIKATSLVNQAETLLHDAQLSIPGTTEASASYESAELEEL